MANVVKNYMLQVVYQILVMILPLITSPYVSRVLGADGIGTYTYTYSIVFYFTIVAKLGIQVYGTRKISAVRDDPKKLSKAFCDLYAIHFIIGVLALAAYFTFVSWSADELKIIFMVQAFHILAEILNINWLYFGLEKFKITVTCNAIIKILSAIAIFLFVQDRGDVLSYALILTLGLVFSEAFLWIPLRKYVAFVKPSLKDYRLHLKSMIVLFIPFIAISIYKIMGITILGKMCNEAQVGFFDNSEKIITLALGFISSLGTVMMPRMVSVLSQGNADQYDSYLRKSRDFMLIFSYAMCFGIIGISEVFPIIFWGADFAACSPLLCGLAISMPFIAVANVTRTQYLIPHNKDRQFVLAVCSGAVVNVLIVYFAILHFKAVGAVIGVTVSEIVVCLVQEFLAWKDNKSIKTLDSVMQNTPFLLLGMVMAGVVYTYGQWANVSISTLLVQILLGGLVFTSGTFLIWKLTGNNEYFDQIKNILRITRKNKA